MKQIWLNLLIQIILLHGTAFIPVSVAALDVERDYMPRKLRSRSSSTTNVRGLQDIIGPLQPPAPTVEPYTLLINSGSTADYVDADGTIWKSDTAFTNTGDIYSVCPLEIVNTTLDSLYCKERYFNKWVHINKPFRYDIPVPRIGSAYTVKLHFAEINYKTAKERVFDVWINGKIAINALDIYNEVGYATALVVPIVTRVTTEAAQISIEFVSRIENPKICAIEIIEILNYIAPPTAAPIIPMYAKHISAGATENWYDYNTGILWEKDQYFGNKGAVHSICPTQINGTELDDVYCKDRYFNKWEVSGPYRYDIPVPTNSKFYSVKLHFAEFYYQTARARIFDVVVNDKLIYKNLDIYKEAGYLTAYVLPVVTWVLNGTISIEFISKVENPKICAIEVMELFNYVPPPTDAPALPLGLPYSIRISAGATEDWIDSDGIEWGKDKYYNNNKGGVHWVCPKSINGTDLDSLYCKDRYFNKWEQSGPYRYDVPVPKDAAYSVKLHFAEVYYTLIGERIFDVLVNGKMAFKNLDIYKEAGYLTAFILPIVTITTNATISIEFISKKENPKICAIEVIEIPNYVPPPPVAPPKVQFSKRINAGATEDWIDDNGITWEKDKYFDGKGEAFGTCPLQIADTDLDGLYCKERYFNRWKYKAPFRYEIPVPRIGAYSVKLHFAEVTYQSRGERIFDVIVGGKVIIGSLDVFAEVGYATAYILPTIAQTSIGFLTIELVPKVEHPKICAIEIVELPDYIAPPTAAPVAQPFEILINSGAVEDFTERNTGRVWKKDNYFIGGGVLFKRHYDIVGTTNDEVFHIERHGEFRYEIPVPPGSYELILHFTELHFPNVAQRLFDVTIENSISFKKLDLIKMTGRIRTACRISYILPITDGLISIDFTNSNPIVDMPKVSGIEVKFVSSSTEVINPFPILINCGGSEYIETDGISTRTWIPDRNFINGDVYDGSKNSKTLAIKNKMYHSGRSGAFRYEIPVAIGRYEVTLHFAELYLSGIGARLFDVVIEDAVTFKNVDVVKLNNGVNFMPATMITLVNVTDGLLTVALALASPAKNIPIISGIEINLIENGPIMVPTSSPIRAPVLVPIKAPITSSGPTVTVPNNCTIPRVS
jgi:Malectin domain